MTMLFGRIEDLSIYYWLQNLFSATSYITIVDGYPVENLTIPSVSVDAGEYVPTPWELGTSTRVPDRMWMIDVFAKNKSQRDEMGERILVALNNNIPVYDYNEGFPPPTPTLLGYLIPLHIRGKPIRIMPELVDKLYYRYSITFNAEYSKL